jgi:hypothetical protein
MAVKLTGRNPARFEFNDGVSQTTVIIQPDDPPDIVRAKLQRVLELEDAQGLPVRQSVAAPAAPYVREELFDAAGAEAAVQRNGWEAADIESLPEA